jgi:large subunit ribosomal protein L10
MKSTIVEKEKAHAEKEKAVESISRQLKESPAVYFVDYMGLTVEEANDLRRKLRNENVSYKVYKNTFICRAIEKEGVDNKLAGYMKGPTAMASSTADEVAPARIIADFSKKQKNKLPRFKVGLVNGHLLSDKEITKMAGMPGRKELLGMLVNGLAAPMAKFAGTLNAVLLNFAYAMNSLKEKKEKEGN